MFKVNNKKIKTTSLVFLLLTLNIFNTFSNVSIVDLEQLLALANQIKPILEWM